MTGRTDRQMDEQKYILYCHSRYLNPWPAATCAVHNYGPCARLPKSDADDQTERQTYKLDWTPLEQSGMTSFSPPPVSRFFLCSCSSRAKFPPSFRELPSNYPRNQRNKQRNQRFREMSFFNLAVEQSPTNLRLELCKTCGCSGNVAVISRLAKTAWRLNAKAACGTGLKENTTRSTIPYRSWGIKLQIYGYLTTGICQFNQTSLHPCVRGVTATQTQ